LIFGARVLAYLPAINGGFLWNDDAHVTRPELQSLDGLRRIWFEVGATQPYYPLPHTAFWIEHHLWGEAALGHHLTNILLHATTACLVVAIVRRLFEGAAGRLTPHGVMSSEAAATEERGGQSTRVQGPAPSSGGWPATRGVEWLAGFIFALHPLCVESEAGITEQKNTLSAVFYPIWFYFGKLVWPVDLVFIYPRGA
jgi:protein O-mannosyl-transferase